MSTSTVNIPVDYELYQRLQRAATWQDKSVEVVLSEALDFALPTQDSIPSAISAEIHELTALTIDELAKVADEVMNAADQATIEQLVDWQAMRPLSIEEQQMLAKLQTEYGRILLRKARAFALLAERGHPLPLA